MLRRRVLGNGLAALLAVSGLQRTRTLLLAATAAAVSIASLGFATPASAAASDGHYCGWISPDSPPG